jgi:hypothetical protein
MRFGAGLFILLVLLSGTGLPCPARAAPAFEPEVKNWPETFFQWAIRRPENLNSRFTGALFDGENSSDLFVDNFTGSTSLNLSTARDVYNNYDLIGSWTVVDRMRLRLNSNLIGYGTDRVNPGPDEAGFSFPFFGVSFGVRGTLEWKNYRQLSPLEVRKLPDPGPAPVPPGGGDITELNPYLSALNLNPDLSAKLKNILKPFTLPFRMPLSRSDLRHMKEGEVIAYNLTGRVGFRGTFGWQVIPSTDLYFGANAAVETFLDGEYEVSVMKETDHHAKVRISRIRGLGSSLRMNAGLDWRNVFQGIFLFKDTSFQLQLGNLSTQVIPFFFELSRFHQKEVDVAYRYNLETAEGREAFHKAVLGSLVLSEDLSRADADHPNPAVVRLYDRSTDHLNWTRTNGSTISLFLNRRQDRSEDSIETEVKLADGTRHLFRTSSRKLIRHNALFGSSENLSGRISLLMDKEGFRNGDPGSLLIIAENSIEDSSTTPRELNRYTRDVGSFFSRTSLFPDFPEETLPGWGRKRGRRAWYGRSSFYYGFTIDREQFGNWLEGDPAPILEFARRKRLDLDSKDFLEIRMAVQNRNPDLLHEKLRNLLSNRNRSRELMDLFRLHLPPESMEKFLVAQNPAFGNIQQRGHRITALETIFRETGVAPASGPDGFQSVQDPQAQVLALQCTPLPGKRIRLEFELSDTPQFMFFSLTPLTGRRQGNAVELVFYDREGRFRQGPNELVLDAESTDPLIRKLASKWPDESTPIGLTIGFSKKDRRWGYGSSCQFRVDARGITIEKFEN